MDHLRCPRCANVVARTPGVTLVCPRCGFGGPPPAQAAHGAAASPPPPPGYGYAPPPGGWPAPRTQNGLAIASMVVGIAGVCFYPIGLIAGIVAIVLGIVALRRIKARDDQGGEGFAWAGIATGSLGVLVGAAVVAFFVVGFSGGFDDWEYPDESDEVEAIEVAAAAANLNEDRFDEVEVRLTAHDGSGYAVTYSGVVELQLMKQEGPGSWTMVNETAYTVTPPDLGSWDPSLRVGMEDKVMEGEVFRVQAKLTLRDGRVFEDFSPAFGEGGAA